ncbi:mCG144616, partial [Mus musculus]
TSRLRGLERWLGGAEHELCKSEELSVNLQHQVKVRLCKLLPSMRDGMETLRDPWLQSRAKDVE